MALHFVIYNKHNFFQSSRVQNLIVLKWYKYSWKIIHDKFCAISTKYESMILTKQERHVSPMRIACDVSTGGAFYSDIGTLRADNPCSCVSAALAFRGRELAPCGVTVGTSVAVMVAATGTSCRCSEMTNERFWRTFGYNRVFGHCKGDTFNFHICAVRLFNLLRKENQVL